MNLFLNYFVFAGGDEEICDGWHAFQCKSSRVSSSSKGIIDKRSSANQEKRRLSSLAHTTFLRQGITSGTFFYVRGRRNEGVALQEKLYLQFLRNWFKIRHSWSLEDPFLETQLTSPLVNRSWRRSVDWTGKVFVVWARYNKARKRAWMKCKILHLGRATYTI